MADALTKEQADDLGANAATVFGTLLEAQAYDPDAALCLFTKVLRAQGDDGISVGDFVQTMSALALTLMTTSYGMSHGLEKAPAFDLSVASDKLLNDLVGAEGGLDETETLMLLHTAAYRLSASINSRK